MSVAFCSAGLSTDSRADHPRKDGVTTWLERANAALSHDFCPRANRWVYWLKRPLWSLVLATGISVLCGVFLKTEALFITAILLLVGGVGIALPWLAMQGVDVHLTFDTRRSRVGQTVMVRLRVRNRWPWPIWGLSLVRGFALRDTQDTDEGVSLARVSGWSTAEYSWKFIPKVRGSYPLADPEIETGFPFGLYRASRNATVDGSVVVWPKTVMLAGLPDAVESGQSDDQLADRRVGDFGDMLGTRVFRSGDSLRRVHWAQTARQQQMIVCERQAPATTAVRVTLDVDADSFPDVSPGNCDPQSSLELAVQVAASVCESLHRQHCRVELAMNDQLLVAGESANSFRRVMDALSQATLAAQKFAVSRRCHAESFEILITTSHRLSGTGLKRHGQHVISVVNHSVSAACSLHGAWISLHKSLDAEMHLQRQWKGACNVR